MKTQSVILKVACLINDEILPTGTVVEVPEAEATYLIADNRADTYLHKVSKEAPKNKSNKEKEV